MAVSHVPSSSLLLPRAAHVPSVRTNNLAAWLPLASVILGILGLFYVAQTSELTSTGYSIQELQVEEAQWKLKNEQLTLEAASAKSLAEAEAQASGRMLMRQPKQVVYIHAAPVVLPQGAQVSLAPVAAGPVRKAEFQDLSQIWAPVHEALTSVVVPRLQQIRGQ